MGTDYLKNYLTLTQGQIIHLFLFFSCKSSHCDVVVWFVEVWQEE